MTVDLRIIYFILNLCFKQQNFGRKHLGRHTALLRRIDLGEFVTTLAHVALTLPAAANDNHKRAQAQTNFQAADVDKNEQLNQSEFKTFINLNADHNLGQASSVRRLGMYTKAFKKADANGDGVVIKEEIAALAQQ
jgi:hypothetical protein